MHRDHWKRKCTESTMTEKGEWTQTRRFPHNDFRDSDRKGVPFHLLLPRRTYHNATIPQNKGTHPITTEQKRVLTLHPRCGSPPRHGHRWVGNRAHTHTSTHAGVHPPYMWRLFQGGEESQGDDDDAPTMKTRLWKEEHEEDDER